MKSVTMNRKTPSVRELILSILQVSNPYEQNTDMFQIHVLIYSSPLSSISYVDTYKPAFFLKALIKPLVLASWLLFSPG